MLNSCFVLSVKASKSLEVASRQTWRGWESEFNNTCPKITGSVEQNTQSKWIKKLMWGERFLSIWSPSCFLLHFRAVEECKPVQLHEMTPEHWIVASGRRMLSVMLRKPKQNKGKLQRSRLDSLEMAKLHRGSFKTDCSRQDCGAFILPHRSA